MVGLEWWDKKGSREISKKNVERYVKTKTVLKNLC